MRLAERWAFTALLIVVFPLPNALGREVPEKNAGKILDDLDNRVFQWFQDNRNPRTGLIRDRSSNWHDNRTPSDMASIASAGYYLSMLPEAVRLGRISSARAREHAVQMLQFVKQQMEHENGLLYHFIDWNTGKRWPRSEVSVLDSAIFFNGCMVVSEAFGGPVAELSNFLLERVAWNRFLIENPKTKNKMLALGWSPEAGLYGYAEWRSSEMAMPYFLAIGARANAIDPECWYHTIVSYRQVAGFKVLNGEQPLFTSYYGLGWHDMKNRRDKSGVDLEGNARLAALGNRRFCQELCQNNPLYLKNKGTFWGISAGDAPAGYVAPGPFNDDLDGTFWPMAALASLPWAPDEIQQDLVRLRAGSLWPRISGLYGLSPFNLQKDWIGSDVIGIDLGSFCINLANYRNRTVWDLWMKHPVAVNAFARLGMGVKTK